MAEAQYTPRLKEQYLSQVRPALTEKFGYKNVLEIPRIEKIVTGAIDEERRLRPEIPLLGEYGIPIHDEVVFARSL